MHRIRWGSRLLVATALLTFGLATVTVSSASAQVPSLGSNFDLDACTMQVSISGNSLTGSGTCLRGLLVPTTITITFGGTAQDVCNGATFYFRALRADGVFYEGRLNLGPNGLASLRPLFGTGESPSARNGFFSPTEPYNGNAPKDVTFIGSENCNGSNRSMHGTLLFTPPPLALVL